MADINIPRRSRATTPFIGSWQDAKASKAVRYIDGASCRRGHTPTIRITSNRQCAACRDLKQATWLQEHSSERRAWRAEWKKKNEDRIRENNAKWVANNYDRHLSNVKKWRSANPSRVAGLIKAWGKRFPESRQATRAKRRAASAVSRSHFTGSDIREIYKAQQGKCAYCHTRLGRNYHHDHITALANGGTNERRNIQLLCKPCNLRKGARDPIDFVQKQFGLLL